MLLDILTDCGWTSSRNLFTLFLVQGSKAGSSFAGRLVAGLVLIPYHH
jgi:hypothetical protein